MTHSRALRTVYAGTPDFAVPALNQLIESGNPPLAVFTQPDRPAGRGRMLKASPVKQAAECASIDVFQPGSLKQAESCSLIQELEPDLLIVVAYGLILPPGILRIPRHGCWNIHASLLPRWRGAAPIQRAIEAGDEQSGVCIMQMDEGLDTGPILHRQALTLAPDETGGSLHDRLAELGATALLHCVQQLSQNTIAAAIPQETEGVSYAAKLDKAEAALDWNRPALTLQRQVRAFNPWPVSWCIISGERVRIWQAEASPLTVPQPPGTVLSSPGNTFEVATADGALRILRLQKPGGREISAGEYLRAVQLPDILSSPT